MHSIIPGRLIPGGKSLKRNRQSVLSQPWTWCTPIKIRKKLQYDLTNPELRCTRILGEVTKIQSCGAIWSSLQRKGLQFKQTRSHAMALFNTLLAICFEKVENMKTGEDLYCKVHQSPRLPRVVLTPNLQHGRQDLPNPKARKSTDHQSEQSVQYRETCRSLLEDTRRKHLEESQRGKYRETCRGNTDYRIPGILHSTVQKEDSNRKETVKRLIQQFENHPNGDSSMEDKNKTEEFNPFSEKSKELINSMGNTSKIQCPACASYWKAGITLCTCGKCMQPTERNRHLNKARYDVLSIPGNVIKKNPTHGARRGTIYVAVHVLQKHLDMLRGSPDQQLVDFGLFPGVHTQQLVCDDIDDVDHGPQDAVTRSLLLSPSRISKKL